MILFGSHAGCTEPFVIYKTFKRREGVAGNHLLIEMSCESYTAFIESIKQALYNPRSPKTGTSFD